MTVKELVDLLNTYDQDAKVVDFEGDEITDDIVVEGVIGKGKDRHTVVYISAPNWQTSVYFLAGPI